MVDSRLIVKAVGVGDRNKFGEVIITLFILGEQYQVVLVLSLAAGMTVGVHVDLTAKYRLHTCIIALIIKFHAAEHHTVVRQRDGIHPHAARRRREVGTLIGPV